MYAPSRLIPQPFSACAEISTKQNHPVSANGSRDCTAVEICRSRRRRARRAIDLAPSVANRIHSGAKIRPAAMGCGRSKADANRRTGNAREPAGETDRCVVDDRRLDCNMGGDVPGGCGAWCHGGKLEWVGEHHSQRRSAFRDRPAARDNGRSPGCNGSGSDLHFFECHGSVRRPGRSWRRHGAGRTWPIVGPVPVRHSAGARRRVRRRRRPRSRSWRSAGSRPHCT